MKFSEFALRALAVCASLAVIAGCGGSQTQPSSLVPVGPNAISNEGRSPGSSWMTADAEARDLLYVSHRKDGSVDVYDYRTGRLEGQLTDARAANLCSDKTGNVFAIIGDEIREYAHGQTHPISVLHDPLRGLAQFCTVDPVTGDLAASEGVDRGAGVTIYANAKRTPKLYMPAEGHVRYGSLTYDNAGDLFAETIARSGRVDLVELPGGHQRFEKVAWSGAHPAQPGAIEWDGKYLVVATAKEGSVSTTLLRYAVGAGAVTLIGKTVLKGAGSALGIAIHGGEAIVPGLAGIRSFGYPAGGSATNVIQDTREPQAAALSVGLVAGETVATYHYDNLRTGWDDNEYSLSFNNVKSGSFGLLHSVTLDDQVDTQPLVVPNETTTGGTSRGRHHVVYVATESNTLYAIDALSGAVLFDRNLGTPVPMPLGCNNNGPNVGIDGTPVIDVSANVMYVIAYTLVSYVPTYTIHELSLANLTDVVPPVVVSASHTLTDGSTYYFNATYQRQRPALLEANGNIYAGFGSFCDFSANVSRGWLLGWQTGSLTPLAANRLNDSLAKSPDDFFLSSIWMSGYGIAADPSGNLYFVTGNSDAGTYNGVTNVQESVVKVSPDLTGLLSIFTPSNVGSLDRGDVDFGSGGVLLLPAQSSSSIALAAAAGKNGEMFLMNQISLGGYNPSFDNVLAEQQIGGCWCGQTYFDAAKDGLPRIVASGGNTVTVWKVETTSGVKLVSAGASSSLSNGQDPGFFTAVSSAGTHPGAIIWAVARPGSVPGTMQLFAFKAEPSSSSSTLETLYSGTAGYWASSGGNANVVPVVAGGRVYVASYKELDILGPGGGATKFVVAKIPALGGLRATTHAPHEVTGVLLAVRGSILTLTTRTGKTVLVDDSYAVRNERSSDLVVGEPFNVRGAYDNAGILHAAFIVRAKLSQSSWPPDR